MMQRFELQILITHIPTDREQLLSDHLGLVQSHVSCRVQVQAPRRLKQLRSRICFPGENSCHFQRRPGLVRLRSPIKRERCSKLELRVQFQLRALFQVGDALGLGERRAEIGN